ncbi:MAG TPA: sugar ABC transporter permease [Candidatus Avoscillospira avicola]|uniref:Sugar ABC transporter permease n=1 Tax=Candidatus Avoscillospira avicola TaxID=2840706 RepID=A0A9D1IY13_9FIRM|nr:sugar ABC transporter permease [Candidatus Avoscillospira avicola]
MKRNRRLFIFSFLAPAVFCVLLVFLYPAVRTVIMSFFDVRFITDSVDQWTMVGLENYRTLFGSSVFQRSLWNILKIWIIEGAAVLALAMIFAVILTSGIKGKGFFRAMLYLPNVISVVALATMWLQYVFNNQYGLFKSLFTWLGWDAMAAFQWTAPENLFLSMMIAYAFGSVGFYVLILVAGIDGLPKDYEEAAKLDGAGAVRRLFYITIPLLKDIIKRCIVLWSAGAIGFFVYSSLFSFNTEMATVTPIVYMYEIVFGKAVGATTAKLNAGGGAAVGVIVMVLVLLVNVVLNLLIKTESDQKGGED